jgi:hypothetical protein
VELPEEPVELSEEELAARVHAAQVQEVMKAITQLPRGLPTSLWGMDISKLAKEIVEGPRKTTPDGMPLVEIRGRWYTADHVQLGSFLEEHKETVVTGGPLSEADRTNKLRQLEDRLLEGKISEETFERLRKKYEEP